MKIPDETSTIVLLGNWNPYILTPEWVGKHIFKEDKIRAEFLIGPKPLFRLRARGCTIITSEDRVTIVADMTTENSLLEIGRLARTLREKLPLTPIHATGFNYAFVETFAEEELLSLFDFPDKEKMPPGMPIERFEVSRRLTADGYSINLKISNEASSEDVRFDFNFHYQIGRDFNEGYDKSLEEGIAFKHFDFARNLLMSQYGLKIEEGQEETDAS